MKPCLFDESGGFFPTKLFFSAPKINIWWYDWSDDLWDIMGFFTVKLWGYKWMWVLENDFRKYTSQYIEEDHPPWDEFILPKRSRKGSIHHYLVCFTTSAYFLGVPIPGCKRDRHLQLFTSIPVFPAIFVSSFLCCHSFSRQSFGVLQFQTYAYTLNLTRFIGDLTCWLVFTQWCFIMFIVNFMVTRDWVIPQ